jgi:hypothetical protein
MRKEKMEDTTSDKEILLYAISFLHANVDDMVEEDLSMGVHEIESRLRKLLKEISNQ